MCNCVAKQIILFANRKCETSTGSTGAVIASEVIPLGLFTCCQLGPNSGGRKRAAPVSSHTARREGSADITPGSCWPLQDLMTDLQPSGYRVCPALGDEPPPQFILPVGLNGFQGAALTQPGFLDQWPDIGTEGILEQFLA